MQICNVSVELLQCVSVAACCSVLQCVVLSCSVLQCDMSVVSWVGVKE